MDFEDLVTALSPPPNRIGKSDGEHEHHLYEGAVTLTLAAMFERQLSIWARAVHLDNATDMPKSRGFQDLLTLCAERAGIDVGQGELGAGLTEMFTVANVVRHGEGSSCEKLKTIAPALWDDAANDYHDLLAGPPIPSEHLRIRTGDLVRYIRATTRFWGLADPLPMALIDPPYRSSQRAGKSHDERRRV